MKLLIDTERAEDYMIDRGPGKSLGLKLRPEALEGIKEAAYALNIPKTQLLNLIGMSLYRAIVSGADGEAGVESLRSNRSPKGRKT